MTPFWIAGKECTDGQHLLVHSPYDGRVVGETAFATPDDVERAVAAAAAVAKEFAATPAHVRAAALLHVSTTLAARADEVASVICAETGKPLLWARGEVARAVSTFRWAAEEARRWSGELQRLDTEDNATGRLALIRRRPRGPVLAITPFNFPLNLVAHKVAPALAVGAPILVKPTPRTPLTALLLGEILAGAALPTGAWSVLPLGNDETIALVQDERLPVISFTGSDTVGWAIRDAVPRKHVTLELGGNAAVVVCADHSSADDLDRVAARVTTFATYQAGQSCISVQRVYVHTSLYDDLRAQLVARFATLVVGDPADPTTEVGPLIDVASADRVERWVAEAVASGATVCAGGTRNGTTFAPTLLTDVPSDARVVTEEVFAPVIVLDRFDDLEDAFAAVNASRFGLQAGVFTHDIAVAFRAAAELDVGGVIIGDVPSFRADQMPYGGVKDSGVGREGVRAAMEDLTEQRVLVLTGIEL